MILKVSQKRRLNVLFSTTRQWNPGDEFILMGCINLLKELVPFNAVIYNRNPQIRYVIGWKRRLINNIFRLVTGRYFFGPFVDNSIKPASRAAWIDLVVFAGSPAWYGAPSEDLYKLILKFNLPVIFLGIGVGEDLTLDRLQSYEKDVISKAKLITTRDTRARSLLQDYNSKQLPCPALLSSSQQRVVEKVKKIGLIFASNTGTTDNRIDEDTSQFLLRLFKELITKLPSIQFDVICHYIDEMESVQDKFPDQQVFYSYDSKDYLSIYNQFDLVIGSRVHGIGICASLGIPGIMISHDIRSETVKGFNATILDAKIDLNQAIKTVENKIKAIRQLSISLNEHKVQTKKEFLELLRLSMEESK